MTTIFMRFTSCSSTAFLAARNQCQFCEDADIGLLARYWMGRPRPWDRSPRRGRGCCRWRLRRVNSVSIHQAKSAQQVILSLKANLTHSRVAGGRRRLHGRALTRRYWRRPIRPRLTLAIGHARRRSAPRRRAAASMDRVVPRTDAADQLRQILALTAMSSRCLFGVMS